MAHHVETIIIGGGQAGLGISYYLTQQGYEHVVLEQAAQPGNAWRTDRWDSFTLVIPNWGICLPGAEYRGDDPDGFMPRAQIVAFFERYVDQFKLPVRYNTRVLSVEQAPAGKGYRVQTETELLEAANVVMATGFFQQPQIPPFSAGLPVSILQLHSGKYRNPETLPPGAVLVVGSGQSGCQIAEELYQAGRQVYLSTGSTGRVPRRYRGRDIVAWLVVSGFFDRTLDMLPPGQSKFAGPPHVSGTKGGHTLNLHQFARDGVVLLGHVRGVGDRKIGLAPDLPENLARSDQVEVELLKVIDGAIARNGLDAPEDHVPQLRDGYAQAAIRELDLRQAGIGSIIWAAGYRFDYSLVKLPIFDGDGLPVTGRGATHYPGLYFIGLPWQPTLKASLLLGVAESAAYITNEIVAGKGQGG